MYLPGQYTVTDVQEMDQISTLRRHFSLYYELIARSIDQGRGTRSFASGLNNPFCNVVMGLPRSSWEDEIQKQLLFFKEQKLPFVWYVDEKANDHFKEQLKKDGFTYVGIFQGVIGPLKQKYELPNLDIEFVQDEKTLDGCIELISETFMVSKEYKNIMVRDNLYHWAAKKDGKVVACLTTLIDGGVVSFWNGATMPEYRRQGLSTALRKLALNHAISKGCHTGASFLMAEALALGICKNLGFRPKWRFEVYSSPL